MFVNVAGFAGFADLIKNYDFKKMNALAVVCDGDNCCNCRPVSANSTSTSKRSTLQETIGYGQFHAIHQNFSLV